MISHLSQQALESITSNEDIYGSFEQNETGGFQWYNSQLVRKYHDGGLILVKGADTKLYPVLEKREVITPAGVVNCHDKFQLIITGNVPNGIKNRCVQISTKNQIALSEVQAYFKELELIQVAKQRTHTCRINRFMAFQL